MKIRVCHKIALLAAVAGGLYATAAWANPSGATLKGGDATITQAGASLDIEQHTSKLIIDWNAFDIAQGETTRFIQPSASAIALNRVTGGGGASRIDGSLLANGRIILVNPNGALFGATARVNVGSLVVSAANIADQAFMDAGDVLEFSLPGAANAEIRNEGGITVAENGLAAFVAPSVANSGVIQGRLAKIGLGAGDIFALDLHGDGLMSLAVGDDTRARLMQAVNAGEIVAEGGAVVMAAATAGALVDGVVNTSGKIVARGLVERDGEIILVGGPRAEVRASGLLEASGDIGIKAPEGTVMLEGAVKTDGGGLVLSARRVDVKNADISTRGGGIVAEASRDILVENAAVKTGGGGISAIAQNEFTMKTSRVETAGGDVLLEGDQGARILGSIMGTAGGDVILRALDRLKSAMNIMLFVENTTINTTGGAKAGKVSAPGLSRADNVVAQGDFGGALRLEGERVSGTGNCLKAGGAMACAAYPDPAPEPDSDPVPAPDPGPGAGTGPQGGEGSGGEEAGTDVDTPPPGTEYLDTARRILRRRQADGIFVEDNSFPPSPEDLASLAPAAGGDESCANTAEGCGE